MGEDYDLFSTYEDALAGTNAWSHESYVGKFPGKSGRCQERLEGKYFKSEESEHRVMDAL